MDNYKSTFTIIFLLFFQHVCHAQEDYYYQRLGLESTVDKITVEVVLFTSLSGHSDPIRDQITTYVDEKRTELLPAELSKLVDPYLEIKKSCKELSLLLDDIKRKTDLALNPCPKTVQLLNSCRANIRNTIASITAYNETVSTWKTWNNQNRDKNIQTALKYNADIFRYFQKFLESFEQFVMVENCKKRNSSEIPIDVKTIPPSEKYEVVTDYDAKVFLGNCLSLPLNSPKLKDRLMVISEVYTSSIPVRINKFRLRDKVDRPEGDYFIAYQFDPNFDNSYIKKYYQVIRYKDQLYVLCEPYDSDKNQWINPWVKEIRLKPEEKMHIDLVGKKKLQKIKTVDKATSLKIIANQEAIKFLKDYYSIPFLSHERYKYLIFQSDDSDKKYKVHDLIGYNMGYYEIEGEYIISYWYNESTGEAIKYYHMVVLFENQFYILCTLIEEELKCFYCRPAASELILSVHSKKIKKNKLKKKKLEQLKSNQY